LGNQSGTKLAAINEINTEDILQIGDDTSYVSGIITASVNEVLHKGLDLGNGNGSY
jgi:hypothetical protein